MTTEEPPREKSYYKPRQQKLLKQSKTQIRNRLRRLGAAQARKWTKEREERIHQELEALYEKPIDQWDLEELARGRPRSPDGSFRGKNPPWITPAVTAEAKRRLHTHAFAGVAQHIDLAVKTVHDLMVNDEVDDKGKPVVDAGTKLKAAQFIIEHMIGKPRPAIEGLPDNYTQTAIAAAIVLDDGLPQEHFVLEGTVVKDDETEGEEDSE